MEKYYLERPFCFDVYNATKVHLKISCYWIIKGSGHPRPHNLHLWIHLSTQQWKLLLKILTVDEQFLLVQSCIKQHFTRLPNHYYIYYFEVHKSSSNIDPCSLLRYLCFGKQLILLSVKQFFIHSQIQFKMVFFSIFTYF